MKKKKSITNQKIGITKIIKTRPKPYAIRLSPEEKRTIEALRVRWQLASGAKVLHKLIGMVRFIEDKYQAIVREQEEQKRKYKL